MKYLGHSAPGRGQWGWTALFGIYPVHAEHHNNKPGLGASSSAETVTKHLQQIHNKAGLSVQPVLK
jgi:hypothetical protein